MLAAFQQAFVALCADARLRQAFARDAGAVLAAYDLSPPEHAALAALSPAELERFARSLVAKRWAELARVVPLTLRVSPQLPQRHRAWALEHPARPLDHVLSPGVAEGLRALAPLAACLAADQREARYASELLAFEVLRAAAHADGLARELSCSFAILEIAAEVKRGLLPVDPDPRPTRLRFERERIRWQAL
jgi:hypothetical protein